MHTYAGYENKVKPNLASRTVSMNMEDRIYEVVIPMEDVVEFKNGKKVVVQKRSSRLPAVRCDSTTTLVRHPQHARRHRLRRPRHQAHAAVAP